MCLGRSLVATMMESCLCHRISFSLSAPSNCHPEPQPKIEFGHKCVSVYQMRKKKHSADVCTQTNREYSRPHYTDITVNFSTRHFKMYIVKNVAPHAALTFDELVISFNYLPRSFFIHSFSSTFNPAYKCTFTVTNTELTDFHTINSRLTRGNNFSL